VAVQRAHDRRQHEIDVDELMIAGTSSSVAPLSVAPDALAPSL
jgi:hypothetical protein